MKAYRSVMNAVFPPSCVACKAATSDLGALCSSCWDSINFITSPTCPKCFAPLADYSDDTALCGACMESMPPYAKARALMKYDQYSKPIIAKIKYHDKIHLSKYVAFWLYHRFKSLVDEADIIVPVPLHRKRLRMRRYNQSALIAHYVCRQSKNTCCIADALIRNKNAPPQTNLTYKQRIQNLKNCFESNERYSLKGKRILLIDDVITTGTTIAQCTKTLISAGAQEVNVLALAKTCK